MKKITGNGTFEKNALKVNRRFSGERKKKLEKEVKKEESGPQVRDVVLLSSKKEPEVLLLPSLAANTTAKPEENKEHKGRGDDECRPADCSAQAAHKGLEIEHSSHAAHHGAHHGASGLHAKQHAADVMHAKQHVADGLHAKQHAADVMHAKQHVADGLHAKQHVADILHAKHHAADGLQSLDHTGDMLHTAANTAHENGTATITGTSSDAAHATAEKASHHSGEITHQSSQALNESVLADIPDNPGNNLEMENVLRTGGAAENPHAGEAVEKMEVVGDIARNIAPVVSGGVGAYFTYKGVKGMRHAIKEKNAMEGLEAGSELALGTAANIKFGAGMSKALGVGEAVLNSPIAHGVAAGLGVAHGAADMAIGGKHVYDGIKGKNRDKIITGAADIAIGASIIAISTGGGLAAGAALGVVFLGKMGYKHRGKLKNAAVGAGRLAAKAYNGAKNGVTGAVSYTGGKVKTGAGKVKAGYQKVRDKFRKNPEEQNTAEKQSPKAPASLSVNHKSISEVRKENPEVKDAEKKPVNPNEDVPFYIFE